MFILSNICCFYRSIILNAPFSHCLYEAIFAVFIVQLSSTRRSHCLHYATFVIFIVKLSPACRLVNVYTKQPLLFLSLNYRQRAV